MSRWSNALQRAALLAFLVTATLLYAVSPLFWFVYLVNLPLAFAAHVLALPFAIARARSEATSTLDGALVVWAVVLTWAVAWFGFASWLAPWSASLVAAGTVAGASWTWLAFGSRAAPERRAAAVVGAALIPALAWWREDPALTLQAAVQHLPTPAVAVLLLDGRDPGATRLGGLPPLMQATLLGRADVVALLLRAGADPRVIDGGGEPVLTSALLLGNEPVVAQLLGAGAGADPAAIAAVAARGRIDLVERLLPYGPPLQDAIDAARRGGHVEIVQALTSRTDVPERVVP